MSIDERMSGLVIMVKNVKKMDPANFGTEPVSGFIDALVADLESISEQYCWETD